MTLTANQNTNQKILSRAEKSQGKDCVQMFITIKYHFEVIFTALPGE